MMKNVHAILSDLHRLLSAYEREDFVRASKYPGLGPSLRSALRALASEVPAEAKSPKTSRISPEQVRKTATEQSEASNLNSNVSGDRPALVDAILNSSYGSSVNSLRSFASNRGLKLDARPKESKERLAKRLGVALAALPESKRNQLVADLLGGVSNQTQGWIDVIKGSKK